MGFWHTHTGSIRYAEIGHLTPLTRIGWHPTFLGVGHSHSRARERDMKKLTTNQTHDLLWIRDGGENGQVETLASRELNNLRTKGLVARKAHAKKGRHQKATWTLTEAGLEAIAQITLDEHGKCGCMGCMGHTS